MTPEDPRAARTRAKLRQALLAECAEQPLEEIGVAALVRRAGVGRATFYVHYADLEALAVDACADVVREAVEALHAWRGRPDLVSAPPTLRAFFTGLAPHTALYRALLSPGGGGPLGRVLHRDLRARSLAERTLMRRAGRPARGLRGGRHFRGRPRGLAARPAGGHPGHGRGPGLATARRPAQEPVTPSVQGPPRRGPGAAWRAFREP